MIARFCPRCRRDITGPDEGSGTHMCQRVEEPRIVGAELVGSRDPGLLSGADTSEPDATLDPAGGLLMIARSEPARCAPRHANGSRGVGATDPSSVGRAESNHYSGAQVRGVGVEQWALLTFSSALALWVIAALLKVF